MEPEFKYIWGYDQADLNYEAESGYEHFDTREEALKSAGYNFSRGGFGKVTPKVFLVAKVEVGGSQILSIEEVPTE